MYGVLLGDASSVLIEKMGGEILIRRRWSLKNCDAYSLQHKNEGSGDSYDDNSTSH